MMLLKPLIKSSSEDLVFGASGVFWLLFRTLSLVHFYATFHQICCYSTKLIVPKFGHDMLCKLVTIELEILITWLFDI